MGSTESKGETNRLELEYRLVRRFISDFYDGTEITIVEHKQTKEQVALREIITQFNPQSIVNQLQNRKLTQHRNLIQTRNYWMENDFNICSNLFKLYAIFQYHENTLEDSLADNNHQPQPDAEVLDFVRQMNTALNFLEKHEKVYLLAGPKSIVVTEEEGKLEERSVDCNSHSRYGHSRLGSDFSGRQRCSLADLNCKNIDHDSLGTLKPNSQRKTPEQRRRRKVYKLFEPLQGFASAKLYHNLENYLQVPLHPQLATSWHDHILLPQSIIKLQNVFTVVLTALAMSEGCQLYNLNVLKSGKLSLEKLKKRVEKLGDSHPRTSNELLRLIAVKGQQKDESFARSSRQQSLKMKDFSFIVRRQQQRKADKENQFIELRPPSSKVKRVFSRKRISLLHG